MQVIRQFALAAFLNVVFLTPAAEAASDADPYRERISVLAGEAIGGPKQFVLLYMPAGSDEKAGVEQLAGILGDIRHPNGLILAVGSEDTERVARIAKSAFSQVSRGRLEGCLVVFVGSLLDQESVGKIIVESGAEYQFVEFKR